MHAAERDRVILNLLEEQRFVSFRELSRRLSASAATLRRDLERLQDAGKLKRVRGGAQIGGDSEITGFHLQGVPFNENVNRNRSAKEAIGKAAAQLCKPGEAVIIDGGSTTLQMCPHLEALKLQVLTNSLHIVSALLAQPGTRVLVPGGAVFREQNIILSASGDDLMPRYYAPKLFMGATAVGPQGIMQPDIVLVAAERRLIDRAEQLILLVDSSKFRGPSGNVVCGLEEVDVVITDAAIEPKHRQMLEHAGVKVVVV